MSKNTKLIFFGTVLVIAILAGFYIVKTNTAVAPSNGTMATSTETSSPLVRLTTPRSNDEVESPLVVKGEARGNWYFEASFPARLLDGNGKEIAIKPAQAQGDWMTTEFVPFEVLLTFDPPTTKTGTLVLEKDNPSGLPEYAAEVRIPIRFKDPNTSANVSSGIHAIVTIGPTCPVVRYPPDDSCNDKPYQADFKITKKGSLVSKNVSSNDQGELAVSLSPGEYTISAVQKNVMPSLSPVVFTVREGVITELTLQFDSGIR